MAEKGNPLVRPRGGGDYRDENISEIGAMGGTQVDERLPQDDIWHSCQPGELAHRLQGVVHGTKGQVGGES